MTSNSAGELAIATCPWLSHVAVVLQAATASFIVYLPSRKWKQLGPCCAPPKGHTKRVNERSLTFFKLEFRNNVIVPVYVFYSRT